MITEEIGYEELPIIDCRDLSPEVPFLWRDQPRPLPYESPLAEYLNSPHLLDQQTLRARWEGLAEKGEIEAIFRRPFLEVAREMAQAKILEGMGISASSPEYVSSINNLLVMQTHAEITRLKGILDSGYINDSQLKEFLARDEDSYGTYKNLHYKRPLKVREITQLERALDEKIKVWRLLTEQATEIADKTVNVEVSVNDVMRASLRRMNPEYARLEQIARGELGHGELSEPENRIIDVTNETEIR